MVPPSAARTMLGICVIPVVGLYCSAHGCCAVERNIACCAKHCTANATLTTIKYIISCTSFNPCKNKNHKEKLLNLVFKSLKSLFITKLDNSIAVYSLAIDYY